MKGTYHQIPLICYILNQHLIVISLDLILIFIFKPFFTSKKKIDKILFNRNKNVENTILFSKEVLINILR
jgi:hypothetical protein